MTDQERSELMLRLVTLQRLCPDMRIGQMIANLAVVARGTDPGAIWEMEDQELLEAVNWQIAELVARGRAVEGVA